MSHACPCLELSISRQPLRYYFFYNLIFTLFSPFHSLAYMLSYIASILLQITEICFTFLPFPQLRTPLPIPHHNYVLWWYLIRCPIYIFISGWLKRKLFLKVNATKTKVVRPTRSKYLGFTYLKSSGEWKVKLTTEKKKRLKKKLS